MRHPSTPESVLRGETGLRMPRAQDVPREQRPEITEGARRAARFTYAARRIQTIVDGAPKLTDEQLDRLAALLRPEGRRPA
jgi:hypothetical protein